MILKSHSKAGGFFFPIFANMRTKLYNGAGILLVLALILGGCENDIERINLITDELSLIHI
mgnify:CR=1 FL=1